MHEGQAVVYIEHVQSAPWNNRRICEELRVPPRFKGVGESLVEYAVRRSIETGCAGRVLLFSLPEAESFYDRIGFYRLGRERLMGNHMRYELTQDASNAFLARQNRRRPHAS